jgi:FERM, RhoGEF and pleckstrin domain protein 2
LNSLDYHGINGTLDRSEKMSATNRYDMTLGSDKSASMTYDLVEAEQNNHQNYVNNNNNMNSLPLSPPPSLHTNGNGMGTLERSDTLRKKWPTDKAYYISKEILMTERTYRRDLDVINLVNYLLFPPLSF